MQSTTHSTIRRAAVFGSGIILGLSVMSGAASAAPTGWHASHNPYTEDTDTNDNGTMNNVPDDGDNRHPSGRDRSVEHGRSGNQGRAHSDPDDDGRGPDRTNGGPDQPNGSGGVDAADQDGNNGCGNDDDFEDDNEGWCGKPTSPPLPETPPPGGGSVVVVNPPVVVFGTVTELVPAPVLPTQPEVVLPLPVAPAAVEHSVVADAAPRVAEVKGVTFDRPAEAAVQAQVQGVTHVRSGLARTGFDLTLLAMAAAALVTIGAGFKRMSRSA